MSSLNKTLIIDFDAEEEGASYISPIPRRAKPKFLGLGLKRQPLAQKMEVEEEEEGGEDKENTPPGRSSESTS